MFNFKEKLLCNFNSDCRSLLQFFYFQTALLKVGVFSLNSGRLNLLGNHWLQQQQTVELPSKKYKSTPSY